MQRITITLDEELAEQFEAFRISRGYGNRSEAFRDLVRERLDAENLEHASGGHCVATLTYVFDHHRRDLAARITRVSHDHHDLIVSTLHVHLDHDNCMETVILRGPMQQVRHFADRVAAQPDIRHARLHVLPVTLQEQTHPHGTADGAHAHLHLKPIN